MNFTAVVCNIMNQHLEINIFYEVLGCELHLIWTKVPKIYLYYNLCSQNLSILYYLHKYSDHHDRNMVLVADLHHF